MTAWNNGKYKTSTNAKSSSILVKTLRNVIDKLKEELKFLIEGKVNDDTNE